MAENSAKMMEIGKKFLRFPRHIGMLVASHFTFSAALVLRHDAHDDALIFCSLGVQT